MIWGRCRNGIWPIFTRAPDSPELKADLEAAARDAKKFQTDYQGKLAALSSDDFGHRHRRV